MINEMNEKIGFRAFETNQAKKVFEAKEKEKEEEEKGRKDTCLCTGIYKLYSLHLCMSNLFRSTSEPKTKK